MQLEKTKREKGIVHRAGIQLPFPGSQPCFFLLLVLERRFPLQLPPCQAPPSTIWHLLPKIQHQDVLIGETRALSMRESLGKVPKPSFPFTAKTFGKVHQ